MYSYSFKRASSFSCPWDNIRVASYFCASCGTRPRRFLTCCVPVRILVRLFVCSFVTVQLGRFSRLSLRLPPGIQSYATRTIYDSHNSGRRRFSSSGHAGMDHRTGVCSLLHGMRFNFPWFSSSGSPTSPPVYHKSCPCGIEMTPAVSLSAVLCMAIWKHANCTPTSWTRGYSQTPRLDCLQLDPPCHLSYHSKSNIVRPILRSNFSPSKYEHC